ncbi:glycoside hydrolase family 71 protein [Lentinula aciculospora]|uniref:Glycoside hydrolase family 71 protein n=1 Tax=Lentinula aciculospora TaxID=153920 RepID=A0A9W9AIT8_9AGAR|nr:glycoside hydrolase family 71 protein [Lentinula aciculospora]
MEKYVLAHFIVGNTFPYTEQDWLGDIILAHEHNIDGFALNVGREAWQLDRISDCFSAASKTKIPFWLLFSFDMSSLPSTSMEDVQILCSYIEKFGKSERMLRYGDGLFVSTFAGEQSLFGQPTLSDAWSFVKERLTSTVQTPIHYVPSLFIDPALYSSMKFLDGAFNWNGSWPIHLNSRSSRHEIECATLDTDDEHIRNLDGRTFMSAVSPWFFTHYGSDSWNKNWIYRGDDWLFVRRWEQLIAMRDQVDIVQIISWNDYGESHYIGPVKGAQPNSEGWVDGYPHSAFLKMTAYFSRAFKEGQYPPVSEDQIFAWARPHPKNAVASNDRVPKPDNWDLTDDKVWVLVLAKFPATVAMYGRRDFKVSVRPGVTKLSQSLEPGDAVKIEMQRDGMVVAQCSPFEFTFEPRPLVYNFNVYTASS